MYHTDITLQVYIDSLDYDDLVFIASSMHPGIDVEVLKALVDFNTAVQNDVVVSLVALYTMLPLRDCEQ